MTVAKDVAKAKSLLKRGMDRADALLPSRGLHTGPAPGMWQAGHGPVALGYISKIDGSVQPYGLVVPGPRVLNAPAPICAGGRAGSESLSLLGNMLRQADDRTFAVSRAKGLANRANTATPAPRRRLPVHPQTQRRRGISKLDPIPRTLLTATRHRRRLPS